LDCNRQIDDVTAKFELQNEHDDTSGVEKCVPLEHIGKPNARRPVNPIQVKRVLRPFRKISGVGYNSNRKGTAGRDFDIIPKS